MKKEVYIKPSIEVITIESSHMLSASSIEVKLGESGEDQLSNHRRGTWGNLWADER